MRTFEKSSKLENVCYDIRGPVMDEANRCLQCKVPQCQKGCPINTNIPVAIRLLKENKLNEAAAKIKQAADSVKDKIFIK